MIFIEITFYVLLSIAAAISVAYLYTNRKKEKSKELLKNQKNSTVKVENKEVELLKEEDDQLELRSGIFYQEQGYEVFFNGIIKGYKDDGIDLICKKDDELILVQCKDWYQEGRFKVRHVHVKAFHSDCLKYLEENDIDRNKNKIKFEYIVPNSDIIHISALKVFGDTYYNCSYKVI